MLHEPEQPAVVREVMRVDVATEQPEGARIFRGQLKQPADSAYARLRTALSGDTVPLLQQDETSPAAIVLMPKPVERHALTRPVRPWVHWLLFALTIATTTWAGAAHQGVDVMREPGRILAGLPYSLTLMAILGVHELGHYFTARHHGIRVTPPYFIPVPPLNDLTPLTPGRTGLGYASFAILLLIQMPLPHALWSAVGLYCPYL